MTDVNAPDITGADIKTAAELEAANEARIERLTALGVSEPVLNLIALQVRVEAIATMFPPSLRQEMERRYEAKLGEELDGMYAYLTTPRIITPPGT